MPHQETLTVIAEVVPGQLAPLQQLLGRIRDHVDDWNVVPFAQLRRIHFARFIALDASQGPRRQTRAGSTLPVDQRGRASREPLRRVVDRRWGRDRQGVLSLRRLSRRRRTVPGHASRLPAGSPGEIRGRAHQPPRAQRGADPSRGGLAEADRAAPGFGRLQLAVARAGQAPDRRLRPWPPGPGLGAATPAAARPLVAHQGSAPRRLRAAGGPRPLAAAPARLAAVPPAAEAPREARRAEHVRGLSAVGAGVSRRRGLLGPEPDRGRRLPQAGRLSRSDHARPSSR